VSTNLKALIEKLNDTTRRSLEAAAGLCVSRTHYDIEIEHYLLKTLDSTDNDIAAILKHFGVDRSRLTKELERSLDALKSGNARSPSIDAVSSLPVTNSSTMTRSSCSAAVPYAAASSS